MATSQSPALVDPDTLIERYAGKEKQDSQDIRRGCLIAFSAIVSLLALILTTVWWFAYR